MCFAVMEHCDESLADLLRQRLLTPAEAREVLAPTLDRAEVPARTRFAARTDQAGAPAGQRRSTEAFLRHNSPQRRRTSIGHREPVRRAGESCGDDLAQRGCVVAGHHAVSRRSLVICREPARTGCESGRETSVRRSTRSSLAAWMRERERRLSLSAIRAILDKPVTQVAEGRDPKLQLRRRPT